MKNIWSYLWRRLLLPIQYKIISPLYCQKNTHEVLEILVVPIKKTITITIGWKDICSCLPQNSVTKSEVYSILGISASWPGIRNQEWDKMGVWFIQYL